MAQIPQFDEVTEDLPGGAWFTGWDIENGRMFKVRESTFNRLTNAANRQDLESKIQTEDRVESNYIGTVAIKFPDTFGLVELSIIASRNDNNNYGTVSQVLHIHLLHGYPQTQWSPKFSIISSIDLSQTGSPPTLSWTSTINNIMQLNMQGSGALRYNYEWRYLVRGQSY